jgi:hypothetical protein
MGMSYKLLVILFLSVILILCLLVYKIGDNDEALCKLTSGSWVKAGVYGHNNIRFKVEKDYCERPLLFGLIKKL